MKRILMSLVLIGSVSIGTFGLTRAFFSDSEVSNGNVLGAGSVDLLVTNTSYYNGEFNDETSWTDGNLVDQLFFNFADLKPGDWGEDTISLTVDDNDAWACYDISLTSNDDNGNTEPELLVDEPDVPEDLFDGELASSVFFAFWLDDGDNVYEEGESIFAQGTAADILPSLSGALADSDESLLTSAGDPLIGGQTYHIGKYWCFGEMGVAPLTQDNFGFTSNVGGNGPDNRGSGFSCDGSGYGNETQTDILTGDITFSAVQHRNNPDFQCEGTDITCGPETTYVSGYDDFSQGQRKNTTAVLANRSNPEETFGAPTGLTNPPEWLSLGFGGSIVTEFANIVGDGAGVDLYIHEITGGRNSYPEELALIEVSEDGVTWTDVGQASSKDTNGVYEIDLSDYGVDLVKYVRVTDQSNPALHVNDADGFDLDAIEAVYGACGGSSGGGGPIPGGF